MSEALITPERGKGIGLVLVSGACWGFHGILIKYALSLELSFIQVFFAETLFAACFFGLFHKRFFAGVRPRGWGEWGRLLLIGLSAIGVGSLLFLSFSLGPVAIAATLMFFYVPVVYLFSVLARYQAFHGVKLMAIVMILGGAVLTTQLLSSFGEPDVLGAALAAMGASCCYAVVFILTPAVGRYTNLYFRSFAISIVGLLGCCVILLLVPDLWYAPTGDGWRIATLALALGVIGQVLPVFALMKGLPLTGGSLGGVVASVELPIAVFSAAILLNESLTIFKVIGVMLVLSGIIIYNFCDRRAPSLREAS
ncbi:MAG: EamA family transporter [Verrucomicrobia bacterium]|nr:EamA family transporter [Verrucomicrobiota bacterium]